MTELAVCSRRSIRKQCKLSDYVTTQVAQSLSCQSMLSCQTIPSVELLIEGQGDNKIQPKTPSTPKNSNQLATRTPLTNPLMTRIQRDLNSPSANVRLRALKAIRSPTKNTYGEFDVSHSEKSIITADERAQATKTPPTLREILKDIIVYVEVRTDDDDRSAGVKKVIAALGARVNDTLKRDTTHVIFKDGRQSTFKKAKSLDIPIVSILWIEACKNQRRICDPKDFQISNLDRYENPELYGKMKRYKFIQPGAEDKKRRFKKQTVDSTPPTINNSQTEIGRFFKALNKTSSKTDCSVVTPVRSNIAAESPATVLLNRMTSNTYTPIAATTNKTKSATKNTMETTPLTRNCRLSSIETNISNTTDCIAQMSISQLTPIEQSKRNTTTQTTTKQRRRTMLPIANSTRISDLNETITAVVPPTNETIVNEEVIVESNKSAETFSVASTVRRQTTINCKSMDVSEMTNNEETPEQKQPTQQQRRRTLFTPQSMIECSRQNYRNPEKTPVTATSIVPTEPLNDETIIETLPMLTTTPTTLNSAEQINVTTTPAIGSARHMCRRRTLFDLSMDIVNHQVQHINAKSRQSLLSATATTPTNTAPTTESEVTSITTTVSQNKNEGNNNAEKTKQNNAEKTKQNQVIDAVCDASTNTVVEKKKRKLFKPMELSPFAVAPPPPITPTKAMRQSSSGNSITPKAATKRRRTLMPTLGNSTILDVVLNLHSAPLTSEKPSKASLLSRRSTLDFQVPPPLPPPPPPTRNIERKVTKNSQKMLSQPGSTSASRTNSNTTLKENNINATNSSQTVASGNKNNSKPIAQAKRRLPFLAFTNMRSEQVATINEAVNRFGGFTVERTVGPNTTHMVSLEARRTMNILRGLIRGLWILDYNWILDSLEAGRWLNEEQYEMKDFSRAVEICRAERQAFGQHYKCELFADLGAFFISSRCNNMPARDLKELIHMCGGSVVDQRKNAKYILSSATRAVDDKIYVTPLWILDSITKMQLLRIQKYSAVTQLPTKHTPGNTRNMPTAVDVARD